MGVLHILIIVGHQTLTPVLLDAVHLLNHEVLVGTYVSFGGHVVALSLMLESWQLIAPFCIFVHCTMNHLVALALYYIDMRVTKPLLLEHPIT